MSLLNVKALYQLTYCISSLMSITMNTYMSIKCQAKCVDKVCVWGGVLPSVLWISVIYFPGILINMKQMHPGTQCMGTEALFRLLIFSLKKCWTKVGSSPNTQEIMMLLNHSVTFVSRMQCVRIQSQSLLTFS